MQSLLQKHVHRCLHLLARHGMYRLLLLLSRVRCHCV